MVGLWLCAKRDDEVNKLILSCQTAIWISFFLALFNPKDLDVARIRHEEDVESKTTSIYKVGTYYGNYLPMPTGPCFMLLRQAQKNMAKHLLISVPREDKKLVQTINERVKPFLIWTNIDYYSCSYHDQTPGVVYWVVNQTGIVLNNIVLQAHAQVPASA